MRVIFGIKQDQLPVLGVEPGTSRTGLICPQSGESTVNTQATHTRGHKCSPCIQYIYVEHKYWATMCYTLTYINQQSGVNDSMSYVAKLNHIQCQPMDYLCVH